MRVMTKKLHVQIENYFYLVFLHTMRVMTKKLHLYVIWIMFIQARYKEKRPN